MPARRSGWRRSRRWSRTRTTAESGRASPPVREAPPRPPARAARGPGSRSASGDRRPRHGVGGGPETATSRSPPAAARPRRRRSSRRRTAPRRCPRASRSPRCGSPRQRFRAARPRRGRLRVCRREAGPDPHSHVRRPAARGARGRSAPPPVRPRWRLRPGAAGAPSRRRAA